MLRHQRHRSPWLVRTSFPAAPPALRRFRLRVPPRRRAAASGSGRDRASWWTSLRRPDFGDLFECVDELAPHAAPRAKDFAAGWSEPIETAASLARFLDPPARDPALFFKLVEQGIERRRLEAQLAAGSRFNDLRQFIPMPIGTVEDRQQQELGAAFLQRPGRDIRHIGMKHIYLTETGQEPLVIW